MLLLFSIPFFSNFKMLKPILHQKFKLRPNQRPIAYYNSKLLPILGFKLRPNQRPIAYFNSKLLPILGFKLRPNQRPIAFFKSQLLPKIGQRSVLATLH